jgi:two-component system, NtrC family, nitrogen regulation response regulator GlnG
VAPVLIFYLPNEETKMARGTILVADDDGAIRTVLNQALVRAGYMPRATGNAATLWRWVSQGEGDCVITDVVMPDENAFDLIPRIKRLRPELPIIVMSAQNTLMTALSAAEKGAFEYLPKPFDIAEVVSVVGRALADPARKAKPASPESKGDELPLIGRSPAMQDIYRVIARLTQTDLTVLINGESGTGKELVARVLHNFGRRKNGPFVALNMAAIPRELIESELFGHEKGAFTGAQLRAAGRFEQAEGGTLFLDEIGDMPLEAQTRLLRVLQEGEYTTVGGRTPIKTNVRIVAATHRDLRTLIQQGTFREDLYYRLNVVPMRLPPLRERLDDIGDLTRHFLRQAGKAGLGHKSIEQAAIERLKRHQWPGNVRELENTVRRIAALNPEDAITVPIIEAELVSLMKPSSIQATATGGAGLVTETGERTLSDHVEVHLQRYFASFGRDLPPPNLYDRILADVERPLIIASLTATRGNQIKAAELLGLNRNTLRKKIRDLDITVFRGNGG